MKPSLWRGAHPLLTPQRLKAEIAVMARAYPQLRLEWGGKRLRFTGPLRSNFGSVFVISLALGRRYPEAEPWLWVEDPPLPPETAHRYVNGRVCAHAEPFIPYRTTCAAMVSVMAGWLFRFDRHRLEGVPWDDPISPTAPPGGPPAPIGVHPDGQLYLKGAP